MKTLSKLHPPTRILNDFYVCDTETYSSKSKYIIDARPENFRFACLYTFNKTQLFFDLDSLKKELLKSEYKNKKVFFHNAEYDLNVIYGNIYDLDPEAIYNGSFIRASNGNCVFADSTNIYKTKVSEIGKMLGHNKLFGEEDYKDWIKRKGRITKKDINNCIRDCEIVWDALFKIFEESGAIKITQASLSMNYFRMFHQPFNIDHRSEGKFFWNSYFGGRTEAFKIGKVNDGVIDKNSMYPFHMVNTIFPNPKFLRLCSCVSVKEFIKDYLYSNFEGVAFVRVKHKDNFIGCLPYKQDQKLLFPIGNFSGYWNFNEIRNGLEHGLIKILSVGLICYSVKMASPFTSFVESLYQKKQFSKSGSLDYEVYKKLMNSLYGKFAQRVNEESIYLPSIEKAIDLIGEYKNKNQFVRIDSFSMDRPDGFLVIKKQKGFQYNHSIPVFASYITSNSRIDLFNKLTEYKHLNPSYCDTDSIFLEKLPNLKYSDKLGDWKIENKRVIFISGLKNYSYIVKDKTTGKNKVINRIKGIPNKAEKIGKNKYRYFTMIKTKEALRRNIESGFFVERNKIISGNYDKRIVFPDGGTAPIKVNET